MSITRSELIGKAVYDQEAKFIGTVQDIVIKLEEKDIGIQVRTPLGTLLEISSDKILAVKDIILLKEKIELPKEVSQGPVQQTPPLATSPPQPSSGLKIPIPFKREEKICPYCGKPATYIPQYKRWYCFNCQRYID
ncbi:MAG: PRC-barrel domain-containing protein [Infirmifilum sp.]|jgi:sporulation protein YlmC with PRC-barrel domain/ribosomal protein S27AE|uniref:PRC-barrel domain-containing protein n=1 Tax=Infirmifilum uzonense TaxID=1550241 RepID=A0A0F7FHN8_9CREN|nr:PRC-barrel domain-containing protein [Infirmifilum uzonense]AKG38384.1 hypothetical protein MA03_02625 [Infirmifilum uzonense]